MLGGAALLLEGIRLLVRERRLWALALTPALLAMAAVLLAATLVYAYAGPLFGLLTAWLPRVEAGAWYTWLWIGPAKAALALAGWLLFALASAAAVFIAFLLATIAAAPFLDALSRRVEALLTGAVRDGGETGWRGLWHEGRHALASELQRLMFFGLLTAAITLAAAVVPGAQVIAPPLLAAITILFLPLQYSGYALDRRRVTFRERRRWVTSRWRLMAGFGGTAFLTFLVPGLNFLMIPALVVAGTLLALRHPPPRAEGAPTLSPDAPPPP